MLRPMVPIGRHRVCGERVWQSTSIVMGLPIILPSKIGQRRLQASLAPSCASSLQIEATYPSERMVMVNFLETLHHAMEHPWKRQSTLKGPQLLLQSGMVQTMHLPDVALPTPSNGHTLEVPDDKVDLKIKINERMQNSFNKKTKEQSTGRAVKVKLQYASSHPSSFVHQPNYQEDLKMAIYHQNPIWAMAAYRNCTSDHEKMGATILYHLFNLQCTINPMHAIEVLTHMERSYGTPQVEMYERLCDAVGLLNRNQHGSPLIIEKFVTKLRLKLMTFDDEVKKRLFPRLLIAFVKQKESTIGSYAQKLYNFMKMNNFPLPVKYMEKAMECARHNRAHELPYHEILQRCVEEGKKCLPGL